MTESTLTSSILAQDAVIHSLSFEGPAGQLVVLCSTDGDLTISKNYVQCHGMAEPTIMSSILGQVAVILSPYFQDPVGQLVVIYNTNGDLTISK